MGMGDPEPFCEPNFEEVSFRPFHYLEFKGPTTGSARYSRITHARLQPTQEWLYSVQALGVQQG